MSTLHSQSTSLASKGSRLLDVDSTFAVGFACLEGLLAPRCRLSIPRTGPELDQVSFLMFSAVILSSLASTERKRMHPEYSDTNHPKIISYVPQKFSSGSLVLKTKAPAKNDQPICIQVQQSIHEKTNATFGKAQRQLTIPSVGINTDKASIPATFNGAPATNISLISMCPVVKPTMFDGVLVGRRKANWAPIAPGTMRRSG
ncbi:ribosomal RNA small subunit methyltransferase A [Striga asiatica]|uniref:Ribosomal RNA small subunit methyltransferase A n=1 Tax=Striga asiatica TaxID=4170 RepID=A0A5A7R629_STRAF|nr:ribosomal RNA small subunit methyltransferase A [Striga asiatica]